MNEQILQTGIPLAHIPNLIPALPEMILAGMALLFLVIGACIGNRSTRILTILSVVGFGAVGAVLLYNFNGTITTFGNMFVLDRFAVVMKIITLACAAVALVLSIPYWKKLDLEKPEYPVLVLLATVGMFSMISASNLLALYIGLELQNFALYILASFQRDKRQASEAGLKYFFLGAFSSGIILYGMSLIYGFAGSVNYIILAQSFADPAALQPGLIVGLVMLLCGVAFKISAAPFHMWTPDVYEGAPTAVTALFAMAPKVAAIAMIIRLLYGPFAGLVVQWQQIMMALALLSVFVGAFAGLRQSNLKRLLAYSAIGHIGFVVLALASGNIQGLQAAIAYIVIYVIMSAGAFAVLLSLNHEGEEKTQISDLAGLSKTRPMMALSFMVILFAMIGLPPFAGFLVKLNVIKVAVEANLVWLAVAAVVASVASAFYYLRVIKTMYFDEASYAFERASSIYSVIAVLSAIAVLGLFVWPQPLYDLAHFAVLQLS
jgi:NADH-quinone oxidoreductase subunit N